MPKKIRDSDILIPYQEQWVALSPDRKKVLENDKDLKILFQKIENKNLKDVIVSYVRSMTHYYSL